MRWAGLRGCAGDRPREDPGDASSPFLRNPLVRIWKPRQRESSIDRTQARVAERSRPRHHEDEHAPRQPERPAALRLGRTIFLLASVALSLGTLLVACTDQRPKGKPTLTTQAGDLAWNLWLEPDPPRQDGNVVWVAVEDAQGIPVETAEVRLRYRMPAMGTMPEMKGRGDVVVAGAGLYRVRSRLPHGRHLDPGPRRHEAEYPECRRWAPPSSSRSS